MLDEAIETIRAFEWASTTRVDYGHGDYTGTPSCPACGGLKPSPNDNPVLVGHKEGCRIARILAAKTRFSPVATDPT
jgi:hypothetical protein